MAKQGKDTLDQAYEGLEAETPDRVARAIRWLRRPEARWIRWPVGLALIVAGCFGFLPVLGIEMIPVGLLLIAQDIPFLRQPVGKAMLWLEEKWRHVRERWRQRRKKS